MSVVDIARRVIAAGGGRALVAAELGISKSAVANWRREGIPAKHIPKLEVITGIPGSQMRPDLYPSAPSLRDREASAPEAGA